jgi:inosine-uridine nucleoside N-ribohydrolase
VPVDPTTKTFFTPDMRQRIARGSAPFAAYIDKFGQSYPMWDELAVAAWLDPSIVTRSEQLLVDVDTSFTAGYGDTLSWSIGDGPGLGERPVQVILSTRSHSAAWLDDARRCAYLERLREHVEQAV